MRIALNLASHPYSDLGPLLKRLRIASATLGIVALALGYGLHSFHRAAQDARERDHSLDGAIASIQLERAQVQQRMQQPDNAALLSHVAVLNELFDAKQFSWTLAMEDLETVLPAGVQATTLEPIRSKDGSITLRLRVVGPRDKAVELIRNLERSRYFTAPRLVGESSESGGGPNERVEPIAPSNRVTMELTALYNLAAAQAPHPHADATKPTAIGGRR